MTVDLHGPLEERLFRALNADLCPLLDQLAVLLSHPTFGAIFGVVLAAGLLLRHPGRRVRLVVALASAVSAADFIGARLFRPLFARMRPCFALPPGAFRKLVPAADVGSLPSLHAANFFALATVAAALDRRLGVAALVVAAGVAWARVHGGVHWPTDVLAGAAWGVLCGTVARLTLLRVPRTGAVPATPTPTVPPAPPGSPPAA